MKLKPLNNNIIVTIAPPKVQQNALFCSQNNLGEVQLGKVISSNSSQVKAGESVVFFKYCACPYTLNGVQYLILDASDCVAVVSEVENE